MCFRVVFLKLLVGCSQYTTSKTLFFRTTYSISSVTRCIVTTLFWRVEFKWFNFNNEKNHRKSMRFLKPFMKSLNTLRITNHFECIKFYFFRHYHFVSPGRETLGYTRIFFRLFHVCNPIEVDEEDMCGNGKWFMGRFICRFSLAVFYTVAEAKTKALGRSPAIVGK